MATQRRRLIAALVIATSCVAASSCSSLAPAESGSSSPAPGAPAPNRVPAPETEQQVRNAPVQNAASTALLEQSRDERAAGDFSAAGASIERALRIEPNNPSLWIELAEIKAEEGDRDQAETMARKALTLAGSDRSIRERAEQLL